MAKVENIQSGPAIDAVTPSQAIVNDANRIEYTTDSLGRRLGVKRMSASLKRRVLKALSAPSCGKDELLFMAMVACSCVEIDGQPVPFPTTELQVDALIDRLEQEGLSAIGIALADKFPVPKEEDVKNS